MAKQKSFNERIKDEKAEGYTTVKTGLPSTRFQEDKQIVPTDDMGVTSDSQPGSVTGIKEQAAKSLKSKMKIAPDVSVDELDDKQVGGVPLAYVPGLRNVAGVSGQSSIDDSSKVPYSGGNYRPTTRYAKKRSDDLFELDNTISEQAVPVIDDLADLKEAPTEGIGYNGRKQFKQTRAKKNFAYVNGNNHAVQRLPQQLLNDVSADSYHEMKKVYTSGQIVESVDPQADYPTVYSLEADENPQAVEFNMHKGNYCPTALHITVADGHITDVHFDEERYVVNSDPLTRDMANANWQIDANNVAKSMVKMQTELGRETTEKWSPLGYVIHQPYEYNMLMHDIESTTGAFMAGAYRAAVSGLAYQRNITRKDGINPQANAVKMILEGYRGILANDDVNWINSTNFADVIFNAAEYRRGSAAAIIAMFDSVQKYRTKADLLGLQRSFGLHLSQMDNNLNPLRCKPEFIKALDKTHMFSTMDGSYNAFLPYYSTKSARLINPLSLNMFLAGWKNPALLTADEKADIRRDPMTGTYSQYIYAYSDIRNSYTTRVQHPLIEGLLRWLLKHEGAYVRTFGTGEAVIPVALDFENPNLFCFMLCSAAQDVLWERNIIFRDILFVGDQETYVWDDLESLGKLNPLYSSQLSIGKYDEPLKMGKLADDTKARVLWSEHMQLTDVSSSAAQYDAPWHFNEVAFGNTAGGAYTQNEGFFCEERAFQMSYPSIRDGVRHEYIDIIKDLGPDALRLALDRKLTLPVFRNKNHVQDAINGDFGSSRNFVVCAVYENDLTSATINDYIKLSTLRYDPNSDGRLVVKYDITTGSNRSLPAQMLYCIPKELGFLDEDYTPFVIINQVSTTEQHGLNINGTEVDYNRMYGALNNAPVYDGGRPVYMTSYRVAADAPTAGAIDRSAALTQIFYRCFAMPDAAAINVVFCNRTGLVLSLGYNDGASVDVYGVYNLGSNNESTHVLDTVIRTNAGLIWTLVQRVFFPINPFANAFTLDGTVHAYDPAEAAFYFGVCGFLAADNTQNVLERLDVIDQLGMDYTEDVNIKKSLIFR